ncbi:MAG: hypothetical protein AB7P07_05060 [Hyphomonadaceae bacterium]
MGSLLPPIAELASAQRLQQNEAEQGVAAEAAQKRMAEHLAALRNEILPNKSQVQLDAGAGRFVHTLTDSVTAETLRRYPSEAQLAYSRAVMAYLRAQSES